MPLTQLNKKVRLFNGQKNVRIIFKILRKD